MWGPGRGIGNEPVRMGGMYDIVVAVVGAAAAAVGLAVLAMVLRMILFKYRLYMR